MNWDVFTAVSSMKIIHFEEVLEKRKSVFNFYFGLLEVPNLIFAESWHN